MKVVILLVVIFFLVYVPFLRYVIFNLHLVIPWGLKDISNYFKLKKYNLCHEYGIIRLNSARYNQVFGNGKTLSLVKKAISVYKKYNDLLVYDEISKKFVRQKIHIISNVELYDIPYIKWVGEEQFINIDKYDFGNMDIVIFLLDESGAIFNSRSFRNNISMEFLTRLLQSRKHKMCLYMTSQRFQFTDKILRECCSTVTTCRKFWRIIETCEYDAYELENCSNIRMIRPLSTSFWFATDKDYHSYNTYQLVDGLSKNPSDYLDTREVLETYGSIENQPSMLKKRYNVKNKRRL